MNTIRACSGFYMLTSIEMKKYKYYKYDKIKDFAFSKFNIELFFSFLHFLHY